MDDSLRTRRFGQPQGGGQHAQDTTDGSEADARPHKELQGNVDEIAFTFDGRHRGGRAMSTKLGRGLFGAFFINDPPKG